MNQCLVCLEATLGWLLHARAVVTSYIRGVVTSSSNISLKELMQREERAELAAQAPPTNSRLHRSHSQERADVSIRYINTL